MDKFYIALAIYKSRQNYHKNNTQYFCPVYTDKNEALKNYPPDYILEVSAEGITDDDIAKLLNK